MIKVEKSMSRDRYEVNPESWTLAAKDRYLNSIMYGIL